MAPPSDAKQSVISDLQHDISNLSSQLNGNLEKIQRLDAAKTSVSHAYEQFSDDKNKIYEPALTKATWAGTHAGEFRAIRDELKKSYTALMEQTEDHVQRIQGQIAALESANRHIASAMSSKRDQISRLKS
ncbi:YwqH-like family protein [Numidum massiliense]|uniref:YwqH-like family protein n=1 Tax=Numidum massiliense TaxID=1522315 RepID=UPI0006D58FAF|nr:DUF5082 family protein [Numidum massiliense]